MGHGGDDGYGSSRRGRTSDWEKETPRPEREDSTPYSSRMHGEHRQQVISSDFDLSAFLSPFPDLRTPSRSSWDPDETPARPSSSKWDMPSPAPSSRDSGLGTRG